MLHLCICLSYISYSVPAPVCDAAAPPSADSVASGSGAAERSLSLPQHQTGQWTGQRVSAHRPCVQQVHEETLTEGLSVLMQMKLTRSDSVLNPESTECMLYYVGAFMASTSRG